MSVLEKKTIRYYYWLAKEFLLKHSKIIVLSFFVSFLFIIGIISLSPYLTSYLSVQKRIIGLVGTYDFNTIPDEITNQISNGLVYINEHGEIIPALASSWEVRNKGKEYRFHLKNNLIWDNGKKFSASDISYQFADIQSKAVDDKTIDFFLTKPLSIFPTYLRLPLIKYPLVGIAGLYKVNRIRARFGNITEISLEPNKKGLPSMQYKMYSNETQLLSAYKKGEITEFKVTKKNLADTFSSWKNTTIERSIDYSQLMTLFFNSGNQFLKEKDIKDAIISAVDSSKIDDLGELANGPIQPVSWAYNPNLKKNVFDADLAKKIITKNIEATGSSQFRFITYYDYYDLGDEIVSELKSAGLPVELTIASPDSQNNFDFLLALWKVPLDPDQYYFWHSTQKQGNIGNYMDVRVDKLLEDGRNTLSLESRKQIYFEYQRIMQDNPPAFFLYYPYVYTIKRK